MKWFVSYKYLLLRRFFQIGIMVLFALGNYAVLELKTSQGTISQSIRNTPQSTFEGVIIHKENYSSILSGDLSFSNLFGVIPLSDPFATLQLFVAGGALGFDIWLGALLVVLFYGLIGGRGYCAYVCPINLITDLANYLRRKFEMRSLKMLNIPRGFKYGVLILSLLLSFVFGVGAFEMINPVSMLSRGIVFGMGFAILGIVMIFLFDLFVLKNGFCGHICPIGATFSLIGKFSLWRVRHSVSHCTKCMKCVEVCPEKQVLDMIGKKSASVSAMACIKCGRCVEVCQDRALEFKIFNGEKNESN